MNMMAERNKNKKRKKMKSKPKGQVDRHVRVPSKHIQEIGTSDDDSEDEFIDENSHSTGKGIVKKRVGIKQVKANSTELIGKEETLRKGSALTKKIKRNSHGLKVNAAKEMINCDPFISDGDSLDEWIATFNKSKRVSKTKGKVNADNSDKANIKAKWAVKEVQNDYDISSSEEYSDDSEDETIDTFNSSNMVLTGKENVSTSIGVKLKANNDKASIFVRDTLIDEKHQSAMKLKGKTIVHANIGGKVKANEDKSIGKAKEVLYETNDSEFKANEGKSNGKVKEVLYESNGRTNKKAKTNSGSIGESSNFMCDHTFPSLKFEDTGSYIKETMRNRIQCYLCDEMIATKYYYCKECKTYFICNSCATKESEKNVRHRYRCRTNKYDV